MRREEAAIERRQTTTPAPLFHTFANFILSFGIFTFLYADNNWLVALEYFTFLYV